MHQKIKPKIAQQKCWAIFLPLLKNKKMARIIFNEFTDYEAAEAEVKELFSKSMAKNCGCGCGPKKSQCEVNALMLAIDIDKDNNEERYQADVEAAYKFLTTKCGC